MKIMKFVANSVATLLVAGTVVAQQPPQQLPPKAQPGQLQPGQVKPGPAQPGQVQPGQVQPGQSQVNATQQQTTRARQDGVSQTKDQVLATCLAIGNQEQVQIAKFAKDKVKNSQVKEFASMLAEEHQACVDKLTKIAPQAAQAVQPQDNKSTSGSISAQGGGNSSSIDFVALHRELAQQCFADIKEKLNEDESKMDQCFVGLQLAKHAAMKTQLTVFQRHATGELRGIISENLETTKKHIKVAENLMTQLTESSSSNSSRKSE